MYHRNTMFGNSLVVLTGYFLNISIHLNHYISNRWQILVQSQFPSMILPSSILTYVLMLALYLLTTITLEPLAQLWTTIEFILQLQPKPFTSSHTSTSCLPAISPVASVSAKADCHCPMGTAPVIAVIMSHKYSTYMTSGSQCG